MALRAQQPGQSRVTGWPTAAAKIRSASDAVTAPLISASQRQTSQVWIPTAAVSANRASVAVTAPSSVGSPHIPPLPGRVVDVVDVVGGSMQVSSAGLLLQKVSTTSFTSATRSSMSSSMSVMRIDAS